MASCCSSVVPTAARLRTAALCNRQISFCRGSRQRTWMRQCPSKAFIICPPCLASWKSICVDAWHGVRTWQVINRQHFVISSKLRQLRVEKKRTYRACRPVQVDIQPAAIRIQCLSSHIPRIGLHSEWPGIKTEHCFRRHLVANFPENMAKRHLASASVSTFTCNTTSGTSCFASVRHGARLWCCVCRDIGRLPGSRCLLLSPTCPRRRSVHLSTLR